MKSTCYAVVFINKTKSPPVVEAVGYYGEASPTSNLTRYHSFVLFEVTAESFGEARDKLDAIVKDNPAFSWAYPYVDRKHCALSTSAPATARHIERTEAKLQIATEALETLRDGGGVFVNGRQMTAEDALERMREVGD